MAATEDNLVARAIAGEEDALSALLKEVGPQVRQKLSIRRKWQAALDVSDVMQVTYLEAFLRVRELDASTVAQFAAWLARIAENNLHDAVKELERQKRASSRGRIQSVGQDDSSIHFLESLGWTSTTPSRAAAAKEAQELLHQALTRLPEAYQQVLRLYDLEGQPPQEVAEAMDRSVGAVHMLRARAQQRLREIVGPPSRFFSSSS